MVSQLSILVGMVVFQRLIFFPFGVVHGLHINHYSLEHDDRNPERHKVSTNFTLCMNLQFYRNSTLRPYAGFSFGPLI